MLHMWFKCVCLCSWLQGSNLAKAHEYFTLVQKMATEDQTKQSLVKSNEYVFYSACCVCTVSSTCNYSLKYSNFHLYMYLSPGRALAFVFQGKWREAAESFQAVLDLQPDNMAVSHPFFPQCTLSMYTRKEDQGLLSYIWMDVRVCTISLCIFFHVGEK